MMNEKNRRDPMATKDDDGIKITIEPPPMEVEISRYIKANTLSYWMRQPPPRKSILGPYLTTGENDGAMACLAAYGGTGKSMIAMDAALAMATGGEWLGHQLDPTRVCILDYENGPTVFMDRCYRLGLGRGMSTAAATEEFYSLNVRFLAVNGPKFNMASYEWADRLTEIADSGVKVIIVDTLRRAAPGYDENSSELSEPLAVCRDVCNKYGVSFLFLHHTGKSKDGSKRTQFRGSAVINDSMDTMLLLERNDGDDKMLLHHTKSRLGREHESVGVRFTDTDFGGLLVEDVEVSASELVPPAKSLEDMVIDAISDLGPSTGVEILEHVGDEVSKGKLFNHIKREVGSGGLVITSGDDWKNYTYDVGW